MVLLENEAFLSELSRLFHKTRTTGSVSIVMKKYDGRTKPIPKSRKKQQQSLHQDSSERKCLIRATNGKDKISTVISSKDVNKFQMAYSTILKGNMDNLKKRDKASKNKSKKTKAT